MTMHYSYEKRGFYSPDIHREMPADAVALKKGQHKMLLEGLMAGKRIGKGANGLPVLIDPTTEAPSADSLCAQIDAAADEVSQLLLGDPRRALEYERAAAEAQAFADAGYPGEAVPRTVSADMHGGRSAKEAADRILAQAEAQREAMYSLREARLKAKAEVRQAADAGDMQAAEQVAALAIASMSQMPESAGR